MKCLELNFYAQKLLKIKKIEIGGYELEIQNTFGK